LLSYSDALLVGRGIPVVYTNEAIRRTRSEQNRRNERSLAAAPVSDDADIANVLAFVDVYSHSELLLLASGPTGRFPHALFLLRTIFLLGQVSKSTTFILENTTPQR